MSYSALTGSFEYIETFVRIRQILTIKVDPRTTLYFDTYYMVLQPLYKL